MVVGQYMGTDNWSSHPVSIGIVSDASSSSVVSVSSSSMMIASQVGGEGLGNRVSELAQRRRLRRESRPKRRQPCHKE